MRAASRPSPHLPFVRGPVLTPLLALSRCPPAAGAPMTAPSVASSTASTGSFSLPSATSASTAAAAASAASDASSGPQASVDRALVTAVLRGAAEHRGETWARHQFQVETRAR